MAAGIMKIGEHRVLQILNTDEGKRLVNSVGYDVARKQVAQEVLKQMSIGMSMAGAMAALGTVGIVKLAAVSLGVPMAKIIFDIPQHLGGAVREIPSTMDRAAASLADRAFQRTTLGTGRPTPRTQRGTTDYWIRRYFVYNLFREGIATVRDIAEWLMTDATQEEIEEYEKEIKDLGFKTYDSLKNLGFTDAQIETIWSEYARITGTPERELPIEEEIEELTPLEEAKEEYGVTELKAEAVEDWLQTYEMLLNAGHTPQSAVSQTESIFGWVLPQKMLDPILQQDILDLEESLQPEDATLFEMSQGDLMEWVQDAADLYSAEVEEHWQEDERLLQEYSAGEGFYPEVYNGYPQEESLDNGYFPEFQPEMNDLELRKDLEEMAYGYGNNRRTRRRRRTRSATPRIFKDRSGAWRWSNSGKRVNNRR